jgi:hypothetical protein
MPSGDISCVIRLNPLISLPKCRSSSGLLTMGSGRQGRETSPYASTCALRLQRFVGICSLCRVQVCTWWPWVFWRIVGDGCKYIRQDQNHTQGIQRPASLVYTSKSSSYLGSRPWPFPRLFVPEYSRLGSVYGSRRPMSRDSALYVDCCSHCPPPTENMFWSRRELLDVSLQPGRARTTGPA